MRILTFILLIVLAVGCTSTKKAATIPNKLNGTWVPVKIEMGGSSLPSSSFEKQKLILSDSSYTFIAESVDKGVVKYKDDKLDIYGRDGVNAGKHFTAIYKFENELLVICYNLAGDVYPADYETKGKPMYFVATFKKEAIK